jgi:hypothetical protein
MRKITMSESKNRKNTSNQKLATSTDKNTAVITKDELNSYKEVIGTKSRDLALYIVRQLSSLVHGTSDEDATKAVDLAMNLQHAIQPKDELEALLASQMAGAHHLAMKFMQRASYDQPTDVLNANVDRATKMMRTFTAQMEALNRYRGKGQQKVTVEHVTVNQGGQAVIGVVERPGGGGDNGQK